MVRNVADRAFLPAKNLFEQIGDMMILTGKTIVSAVRPPYPYGGEFLSQFLVVHYLHIHRSSHPPQEMQRGQNDPDIDGDNQIREYRQQKGHQQNHDIRNWSASYHVDKMLRIAHVVRNNKEY